MSNAKIELAPGDKAPAFQLPDHAEQPTDLSSFQGRWLVLYFYPRDNTPGCTVEARDFTCSMEQLRSLNAEVVGVSPDSPASHLRFIDKQGLGLTLLSDPGHEVLAAYGAWGPKKVRGKETEGVIRSTFIIDPKGRVAHPWYKVKVKGHVDEVLEKLAGLQDQPRG